MKESVPLNTFLKIVFLLVQHFASSWTLLAVPWTLLAGPQTYLIGPQANLVGPQTYLIGPQTYLIGPQILLVVPQTNLVGPRTPLTSYLTSPASLQIYLLALRLCDISPRTGHPPQCLADIQQHVLSVRML